MSNYFATKKRYVDTQFMWAPPFILACKQALCMGYSDICFRMARGQNLVGRWERESIYVQILNVNCWLANLTWHMSNTTMCVQPWSVNGFLRMFIFQTKLGVMWLQQDGSAKSKQIWMILSHWNIGGSSFSLSEELYFLQCEQSALWNVTKLPPSSTITQRPSFITRNVTLPFQNMEVLTLRSIIVSTQISNFWLKEGLNWAKMSLNVFTHT